MKNEQTLLYEDTIKSITQSQKILIKNTKKQIPQNYIVATHGPALVRAIREDPTILDCIGIYRVNCSHIGKESDLSTLAKYLRHIHPHADILIDLQGPKPRIHELDPALGDKIEVTIGKTFVISYADPKNDDHLCTETHLRVCFPEIIDVMEVGDMAVFDDGKMTAIVREKRGEKAIIECSEIAGDKNTYILKGRKGICIRNKALGIDCITDHDRKSILFARDILGFEWVDNMMVSYFLDMNHIDDFERIVREEYGYTGNLGGKFETPLAVKNSEKIIGSKKLTLAMFGRGDLRVEMDLRAVPNIHQIQPYFFSSCQRHGVESICATGFLESMMTPDGTMQASEREDMQISMCTGADHLMLSAESSYGAQARACIELEAHIQRETHEKLQSKTLQYITIPPIPMHELLYLSE